ncbi:hypothetical protein M5K25_010996 [Dendrobium thyrsiflorum]|uniref:Reverse transcriptase zinc-binding domain-containing protein n=1 Tax=Dendrobium thyrsiflorum TaxID=117978 RepID=A0ABD0V218_DENTH
MQDRWFCSNHIIFANEDSFNNFDQASLGRIWIKWNSDNISFTQTSSSSQMITGIVKASHTTPFLLSAVYASNSFDERLALWEDLSKVQSVNTLPWVILGDFNCCRFQSDKKGGNSIPLSRLAPFNNFIFDSHLMELPSSGLFHTWYNQRTDNPIHLRLDRILANVDWVNTFPNSAYKVVNSLISDHTPLILKYDVLVGSRPRFMFKNFWCHIPEFWSILLSIFDAPSNGNPIISLFLKLKLLKSKIKAKRWDSSNHIADMCRNLTSLQRECQAKLDMDPLNGKLCGDFKKLSSDLAFYQSTWASWTIQRSKVKWLQKGEEDLKFLYSKIRKRQCFNRKALNGVSFGEDNSHTDNMLGRTQFIKYTITNTIAYWIRGSCIPKSVIKIISKLSAKFLHLGGSQQRKLHLIPWVKFCKPKAKGGLGIVSFQALIHAFNCGVIFRWYNSQSPLTNWLNTRYHSPWKTTQTNASPFWKSLSITASSVRHSFSFHIHHNCRANIQWDHWCNGATLASWFPNFILGSVGEHNSRLSEWINPLGWNIPSSVPAALSAFIRAIPISHLDGVNILWNNSHKAKFRDYYHDFFANDADFILHDLVWHKNHSLRFSAYSWLACMGGLKTAVEMIKRNIHITDSSCNFCYDHMETSAHLLFECDYSFMVLSSIIPSFANFFLRPNLGQALQHVGNLDIQKDIKNGMLLALNASVYHLWIERNSRRFNNVAISACTLIRKIKRALSFKISNWKNGDLIKGCLDIRHTAMTTPSSSLPSSSSVPVGNYRSFKDVLAGSSSSASKLQFFQTSFKGCPALMFYDAMISQLAAPFALTLVGKFVLHRPNLDVIHKILTNLKLSRLHPNLRKKNDSSKQSQGNKDLATITSHENEIPFQGVAEDILAKLLDNTEEPIQSHNSTANNELPSNSVEDLITFQGALNNFNLSLVNACENVDEQMLAITNNHNSDLITSPSPCVIKKPLHDMDFMRINTNCANTMSSQLVVNDQDDRQLTLGEGEIDKSVFDMGSKVNVVEGSISEDGALDREVRQVDVHIGNCLFKLQAQEEAFWKQKEAAKHLLEGDNNIKYFHVLVKRNRTKNSINKITRVDGSVTENVEEIANLAVQHFHNRLNKGFTLGPIDNPYIIPNLISQEDNDFLSKNLSPKEIKESII